MGLEEGSKTEVIILQRSQWQGVTVGGADKSGRPDCPHLLSPLFCSPSSLQPTLPAQAWLRTHGGK